MNKLQQLPIKKHAAKRKISTKTLSVIGMGYVGLPLAVHAAQKGYKVSGIDISTGLVEKINRKQSPFVNDGRFDKAFTSTPKDSFNATSDFNALKDTDVIAICVPTPTENNIPDLRPVIQATEHVAERLRSGQLIVLESTVNPGVTREVILPILARESNLKVGKDFYLAHCPERIDPGNKNFYVGNLNRVVGGITADCTDAALEFYTDIIDGQIVPMNSSEEAEFVKSWENSHRNVMIAMANSAAIICDAMKMDISTVLKGLQSKVDQFGLRLAQPGIGPGGHCIPEDIHYVIKKARQNGVDTRLLDHAAELNDRMPRYAIHQLAEIARGNGEKLENLNVALLGLSYKPNIADMRRSPSIEVMHLLTRYAKSVVVHDPYIKQLPKNAKGASLATEIDSALSGADALFISTAHDEYINYLTPEILSTSSVRYVLDGRNCLDKASIMSMGIIYKGIGC